MRIKLRLPAGNGLQADEISSGSEKGYYTDFFSKQPTPAGVLRGSRCSAGSVGSQEGSLAERYGLHERAKDNVAVQSLIRHYTQITAKRVID